MLSYINRIASDFRREHGYPPNVLLLNVEQLERLQGEFSDVNIDIILKLLDMEIRVEQEILHPDVAWFDTAKRALG